MLLVREQQKKRFIFNNLDIVFEINFNNLTSESLITGVLVTVSCDARFRGHLIFIIFNEANVSAPSLVTIEVVSVIMWESCLLYTSPSPRDRQKSRMPSSA